MRASACTCSTAHWAFVAIFYFFSHEMIIAQLLIRTPENLKKFIFTKI